MVIGYGYGCDHLVFSRVYGRLGTEFHAAVRGIIDVSHAAAFGIHGYGRKLGGFAVDAVRNNHFGFKRSPFDNELFGHGGRTEVVIGIRNGHRDGVFARVFGGVFGRINLARILRSFISECVLRFFHDTVYYGRDGSRTVSPTLDTYADRHISFCDGVSDNGRFSRNRIIEVYKFQRYAIRSRRIYRIYFFILGVFQNDCKDAFDGIALNGVRYRQIFIERVRACSVIRAEFATEFGYGGGNPDFPRSNHELAARFARGILRGGGDRYGQRVITGFSRRFGRIVTHSRKRRAFIVKLHILSECVGVTLENGVLLLVSVGPALDRNAHFVRADGQREQHFGIGAFRDDLVVCGQGLVNGALQQSGHGIRIYREYAEIARLGGKREQSRESMLVS